MKPKDIKWDLLKKGTKQIKPFDATPKKIGKLMNVLLNEHLHLSDEYRYPVFVRTMLHDLLSSKSGLHISYDVDGFGGLLVFRNIRPGFKASLMFVLLDKSCVKPSIIKETRALIKRVMKEFKLKRLEAMTADERIVRLAKMLGFKGEGIQKNGFMLDGILMKNNPLSIVRGG